MNPTTQTLRLPADPAPFPVDKRVNGGLFPMRHCRSCSWAFHTPEALADHRYTVHGIDRARPAAYVGSRVDLAEAAAVA